MNAGDSFAVTCLTYQIYVTHILFIFIYSVDLLTSSSENAESTDFIPMEPQIEKSDTSTLKFHQGGNLQ